MSDQPVRRGRWSYVSDRYNGPRWRLDGTNLDLEYDPGDNSSSPGGCWILWLGNQPWLPIDHNLSGSMEHVERHETDYAAGCKPDFAARARLNKLDRLLANMPSDLRPELEEERGKLREHFGILPR